MKLTESQKNILMLLSFSAVCFGAVKLDDYLRRDGLSKNQKMTLIKKEVANREIDSWKNYGEGYLPAKQYRKLSFDTDGDTNTTEVVVFPEMEISEGIDETKNLKIGEEKTIDNWIYTLEKLGREARKKAPFSEKRDRIPITWQFSKSINNP